MTHSAEVLLEIIRQGNGQDSAFTCANEGGKSRISVKKAGWHKGAGKGIIKSCPLVHMPWCDDAFMSVKMLGRGGRLTFVGTDM